MLTKHAQKIKCARLSPRKCNVKWNCIMAPEEMSIYTTKMSVRIPIAGCGSGSSLSYWDPGD